jgi:hypothetical protein
MNQSCGLRYYFSGALLHALWADLCQCGWHHASEEKITRYQMSHRKLFNRLGGQA